jgi:hypothetical protein
LLEESSSMGGRSMDGSPFGFSSVLSAAAAAVASATNNQLNPVDDADGRRGPSLSPTPPSAVVVHDDGVIAPSPQRTPSASGRDPAMPSAAAELGPSSITVGEPSYSSARHEARQHHRHFDAEASSISVETAMGEAVATTQPPSGPASTIKASPSRALPTQVAADGSAALDGEIIASSLSRRLVATAATSSAVRARYLAPASAQDSATGFSGAGGVVPLASDVPKARRATSTFEGADGRARSRDASPEGGRASRRHVDATCAPADAGAAERGAPVAQDGLRYTRSAGPGTDMKWIPSPMA